VVMKVPSGADERFIVVETATTGLAMYQPFAEPGSTADRVATMYRVLSALPQLTEAEVRTHLAARGVADDVIDARLKKARAPIAPQAPLDLPLFALERITRIGYRNREGQEVVRKTEQTGPDNQRVFVMCCGVCGPLYGAYGCDADIRRCPACQDGPPGVPV
jgi:hypothetical protein